MKQEVGSEKELKLDYLILDLSSFQSTKDFVRTFKEKNLPLHILINNAGTFAIPYGMPTILFVFYVTSYEFYNHIDL